jgi:hypothetical protein
MERSASSRSPASTGLWLKPYGSCRPICVVRRRRRLRRPCFVLHPRHSNDVSSKQVVQRPFSDVKASTSSCVSSGVAPSTTGRTNPMVTDLGQARDRHQLQQIIAGLSEGVILIEPGQRIVWGNEGYRATEHPPLNPSGTTESAANSVDIAESEPNLPLSMRMLQRPLAVERVGPACAAF